MEIKKNIRKIVDEGNIDEMHELSDIMSDVITDLQNYDENCAKKYEMKIYTMANGKVLNREMAEYIVQNMQPYGMRWSYEESQSIQDNYGIHDIDPAEFFTVLNSAYNDYYKLFGDNIENYVRFTTSFINDEDAKEGKVFTYFTTIPK